MLPTLLLAAAAPLLAAAAQTYEIRSAETDEYHPDDAVRLAWLRDEGWRARIKHADVVGLDKEAIKARRRRALGKRGDVQ